MSADPIIIIPILILISILFCPRFISKYMERRLNANNANNVNNEIVIVQGEIVEEEYQHLQNIRRGIVI